MNPIAAHRFYWHYSWTPRKGLIWNIRKNFRSYWRFQWLSLPEIVHCIILLGWISGFRYWLLIKNARNNPRLVERYISESKAEARRLHATGEHKEARVWSKWADIMEYTLREYQKTKQ